MEVSLNTLISTCGLLMTVLLTFSDRLGVYGQRSNRWKEGDLRLVGGRSRNEGTVLVYHWSSWGAICDDYWDMKDANVVCNELGYQGAKEAPIRSRFGKGRRRVWLSGLHCRGNERHLTMCNSRGWGNYLRRCRRYYSSAGVVCNKNRQTTRRTTTTTTTTPRPTTRRRHRPVATLSPRLVELLLPASRTTKSSTIPTTKRASTPPTTRQTTEKPIPTTRSNTEQELETADPTQQPTTKRSTTKKPTTVRPTTHKTTRKTTPQPTTRKVTTRRTTTPEPTTRRPTTTPPRVFNRWLYNRDMWRYYMYFSDGSSITSRPDPRYFRGRSSTTSTTPKTTTTTTTTTTPSPRRRYDNTIGGDNTNDQILNNIISNVIDPAAPQQIRRHRLRHQSQKEGYVGDAPHGGAEIQPEVEVEPVTTRPREPGAPEYDEYRLVGGRSHSDLKEGRIEVRLSGSFQWGVICGDDWDLRAAMVACRHLGIGHAREPQKGGFFGGSDKDKVVSKLRCTGKELRLEDCVMERTSRTPGKAACSKASSVAGIICQSRLPDLEPDLQALQTSVYLQDRYLYYLQCAYEENCLSSSATALYGTRSWAHSTRRLLRFSTIAKNIGTADFRPNVDRNSWEWHHCHQHYHSMEAFSHYDIIDTHGNQVAEGHKASFCLEDSSCNRTSYPKYRCQGFGSQGISVGCQDSYMADIDCQWIDVTDVKPGMYTLKVELNPNMRVPEITFDNNAARCNLYFTTQQVRMWNCTLHSIL